MPKLSDAFAVIVSDGVMLSVSVSDPNVLFTSVSEPLIIRVLPLFDD